MIELSLSVVPRACDSSVALVASVQGAVAKAGDAAKGQGRTNRKAKRLLSLSDGMQKVLEEFELLIRIDRLCGDAEQSELRKENVVSLQAALATKLLSVSPIFAGLLWRDSDWLSSIYQYSLVSLAVLVRTSRVT